MKLTWMGHACFAIESGGYTLILDPYADGTVPGLDNLREKANRVLCSHEHFDHAGREAVEELGGEGPLTVETLETFHDDAQGTLRGPNKIFVIRDGTARVAHLGDLGCRPAPEQMEALKNLDAILIPVGGFFTIDGTLAAELTKELNPRMVIPMHYRDDEKGFGFDKISTLDPFADAMGESLDLGESTVDTAGTYPGQVLVLRPQKLK